MRIGDLVNINDVDSTDDRGRGVVLKFDVYTNHRFSSIPESIVEVLWSNNTISWILEKRLDILTISCKSTMPMV